MSVKIRLSRVGKKNAPIYRIIVTDSRKKRDGMFIENLGTYNPTKHEIIQYDVQRLDYWVSKGAIISDAVKKIQKQYSEQASSQK